jgi:hypothetical protein
MRFEFRTVKSAISTLVVLCVLVLGMSFNVSAQDRGRNWGRSHNRGRHHGWSRGRRNGQVRHRSTWRHHVRRDRRFDRRQRRNDRRFDRRSRWDDSRNRRYRQSGYWRNR